MPAIASIDIEDMSVNNTVTIHTEINGDYEFRLDDGEFQTSNTFEGVAAGVHSVTMRDAKTRKSITQSLVEDVEILAVNGIFDPVKLKKSLQMTKKRSRYDVLTVRVKPADAIKITLASNTGKVDVVLRNAPNAQPRL